MLGPQKSMVDQSISLLFQSGDVAELRSFGDRDRPPGNGYYKDFNKMAQDAVELSAGGENVFVCLNPVDAQLYQRRSDKFGIAKKGQATKDREISVCRWLLIDIDPIRPTGTSASDAQRRAALDLAPQVQNYLQDRLGHTCLVCADSGNGCHILIRFPDVPNDSQIRWYCAQLVKILSAQFKADGVKVDATTGNVARVCTLYGTPKRKGDPLPEYPHRLSRLIHVPDPLEPVELSRVQAITGVYSNGQAAAGGGRIEQILKDRGVEYSKDQEYETDDGTIATRYVLVVCPWISEHTNSSAYLIEFPSGAMVAGCHHDSCTGNDWPGLRQLWEIDDGSVTAADILVAEQQQQPQVNVRSAPTALESYIDPPVMNPTGYYGPLGEIVLGLEDRTEAPMPAMLCSALTYLGNAMGRRCYVQLDARHFPKLYVCLVGPTAVGRKGTADNQARRITDAIDPAFSLFRHGGLSTGEGMLLILDENRDGIIPQPAIFTEREFAAVLTRGGRQGNTLGAYIRDAWDDAPLANSTKKDPIRIEDHHISICAHVTPAELLQLLSNTDVANGFANRFLWVWSRREKRRPRAVGFSSRDFAQPIQQLAAAMQNLANKFGENAQEPINIALSPAADQFWHDCLYAELDIDSDEDTPMALMCGRQAQQAGRLALIFAVADGSAVIDIPHLEAACAVADYVRDSVDYILSRPWWGDSKNAQDPAGMAIRVLEAIPAAGGSMLRTVVRNSVFKGHRTAKELNGLRDLLIQRGQIRIERSGKSEIWHLV